MIACPACRAPIHLEQRRGDRYEEHVNPRTGLACDASGVGYLRTPDEKVALRLPAEVRLLRPQRADPAFGGLSSSEGMHMGPPAPCGCQPYFTRSPREMRVILCRRGQACPSYVTMKAAHDAQGILTIPEDRRVR